MVEKNRKEQVLRELLLRDMSKGRMQGERSQGRPRVGMTADLIKK